MSWVAAAFYPGLFKGAISPRTVLVVFLNLQALEAGTTNLGLTPQSTLTAGSITTLQCTSLPYALGNLYLPGISLDVAFTYGAFWVRWACVFKSEIPF